MVPRLRVYCAISLDGFIAGEGDDLSWLGVPDASVVAEPGTLEFADFLEQVGAMLMGRRTFDVVRGMGGPWPYGDLPVLVTTRRPLDDAPVTAIPIEGDIRRLCTAAQELAGERDVYLDGGALITQALDAGLVDELILTVIPVLLGRGISLYQGAERHGFDLQRLGRYGGMAQIALTRTC